MEKSHFRWTNFWGAGQAVDGVLVDEYGKPVVDASIRAYPADRGFTFAHGSGADVKGTFTSGIT
jgi:hypothetical protein